MNQNQVMPVAILTDKMSEQQRTTLFGWQDQAAIKWLQQVAAAVIKLVWCFRAKNQDKNGRSSLWGRWSTYLEQSSCNYSGNQNPSCFQKTVETVLDR